MRILYVSHHDKFYAMLATSYKLKDRLSKDANRSGLLAATFFFFFGLVDVGMLFLKFFF